MDDSNYIKIRNIVASELEKCELYLSADVSIESVLAMIATYLSKSIDSDDKTVILSEYELTEYAQATFEYYSGPNSERDAALAETSKSIFSRLKV